MATDDPKTPEAAPSKKGGWTRRALLISGGLVGGGLMLGIAGLGAGTGYLALHDRRAVQAGGLSDAAAGPLVHLWIRISPDNVITLISPHTEMGQGAQTGLLQIVADELDADWEQCRVEGAPATSEFANGALAKGFMMGEEQLSAWLDKLVESGFYTLADVMELQITGGSLSIRGTGWNALRHGAASARALLVATAADQLGVPASELTTEHATVMHAASGRALTYGELAEPASIRSMPRGVTPKSDDERRYVGTGMRRLDLADKIFATAEYGIDSHVDGMLFAAAAPSPVHGVKVAAIRNEAEVTSRRGVRSVHIVEDAVAVVADNPWRAEQAVRAVTFDLEPHDKGDISTETLLADMRAALDGEVTTLHDEGDAAGQLAGDDVIEADFVVPFLAHACMEPLNALIWREGTQVHVATGVQAPLGARNHVARVLDVPLDTVTLHARTMGGGFGRRVTMAGNGNWLTQAALLHKQTGGQPIKLIWSREQDIRASSYRPMAVARLRARLDDRGLPLAWDTRVHGKLIEPEHAVPKYDIPNLYSGHVDAEPYLLWGAWRSVDASHNAFWMEVFLDELLRAGGHDPVEGRLALLGSRPRVAGAVRAAAEMSGFRAGVDARGRAMGLAVFESFGSIVAEVAEVSLEGKTPRVHNVWVAIDCGRAVNPDSVEAQMQGAVQFGLSAALYGRIDVDKGGVKQSNYHDYRVVKMADAPRVTVKIVDSGGPVGGAGEPGLPPVAPAVANALAVLGERKRALPMVG